MAQAQPLSQGANQVPPQAQEPILVQLDPRWYVQPVR